MVLLSEVKRNLDSALGYMRFDADPLTAGKSLSAEASHRKIVVIYDKCFRMQKNKFTYSSVS